MPEQKKESKKDVDKVLYIGDDLGYWSAVKKQFKQAHASIVVEFEHKVEKESHKFQQLIPWVVQQRFKVVYIDFSTHKEELLHLARVLTRLNLHVRPVVIGLLDYNTPTDQLGLAMLTGCHSIHIKCGEHEAVVYNAVLTAWYDKVEGHGFAKATLNDDVNSYMPSKVGIVSPFGVRVESDFKALEKQQVNLITHWSKEGIIKSAASVVVNTYQEDLYYSFEFAQELSFAFADPVQVFEDTPEHVVQELEEKRDQDIEESQRGMHTWVEENQQQSRQKRLKVLVIDKELTMLQAQEQTDNYEFSMRVQPFIKNAKKELFSILPQVIFIQLEELSAEEQESSADIAYSYNTKDVLKLLVKTAKDIEDYEPYFVVFNIKDTDTAKIRNAFNYSNIMTFEASLNPVALTKMAQKMEKKLFETQSPQAQDAGEMSIVYLDKSRKESYAEFELPIKLLSGSEMDLYFQCDRELPIGTILRLAVPTNFYITVCDHPKDSQFPKDYYGLIHGIGEKKKQELRKFVNSVFFRELDAQKLQEREAYEQLKKQTLENRKKAEEAARIKAEEAAAAIENEEASDEDNQTAAAGKQGDSGDEEEEE